MKVKVIYMCGKDEIKEDELVAISEQHAGFRETIPVYQVVTEDEIHMYSMQDIIKIVQGKSRITVPDTNIAT
jgi:hypothetical protein